MEKRPPADTPFARGLPGHRKRRIREFTVRYHKTDEAVIATDLEGVVIFWNHGATRLFGWSAKEAVGRTVEELTVAEGMEEQARRIMSTLRSGRTWTGDFVVRRRDGSTIQARVTNSPIVDRSGEVIGIIGVSSPSTDGKPRRFVRIELD